MEDQLRAGETPAEGVRRIILERVDYIHEQMLNPVEGREKAVHNARKSCKRIRAALRLIRDDLGEATYHHENLFYRDTSRLVAPIRDSAVLLEVLDKLEPDTPSAPLLETARERLTARHAIVSQQLLEESDVMERVAERMKNGRSRILALPLSNAGFVPLASGMRRVYRQGRHRMANAYSDGRPESFHEWRKQVKYLWHHLEVAQPTWPFMLGALAEELNHLSDFLGDAHDLEQLQRVLQTEAVGLDDDPSLGELMAVLARRRYHLEQSALALGQRIYAEKPVDFVIRLSAYWAAWETGGALGMRNWTVLQSLIPGA